MSILLRDNLREAMQRPEVAERLVIMPLLDSEQVGSGSIDLRLGTEFLESQRRMESGVDPLAPDSGKLATSQEAVYVPLGGHFVLHPGQFVLGATFEFVRLPTDLAGQVVSRSSWGRLGLIVATAVAVQPGFAGCLTLELVNAGSMPIFLYPGLRVAQLQLWSAPAGASASYASGLEKYRAPLGPESNRLAWESGELDRLRRIGDAMSGSGG
jgi:dCTP deaminase